jgi:hypothetical protein
MKLEELVKYEFTIWLYMNNEEDSQGFLIIDARAKPELI